MHFGNGRVAGGVTERGDTKVSGINPNLAITLGGYGADSTHKDFRRVERSVAVQIISPNTAKYAVDDITKAKRVIVKTWERIYGRTPHGMEICMVIMVILDEIRQFFQ